MLCAAHASGAVAARTASRSFERVVHGEPLSCRVECHCANSGTTDIGNPCRRAMVASVEDGMNKLNRILAVLDGTDADAVVMTDALALAHQHNGALELFSLQVRAGLCAGAHL